MSAVLQTLNEHQLEQIHQITGDHRFFDEETGKFTVYFRTQDEADRFTAIIKEFEAENSKLINQLLQ